jgi:hypothetical protein
MLIPQFSLRWLLALTALCAGVSLVLSLAIRGQTWAMGAAAALGGVVSLAALYVIAFLSAWLISQLAAGLFRRPPMGQSPFANVPLAEAPFGGPPQPADAHVADNPPPISG